MAESISTPKSIAGASPAAQDTNKASVDHKPLIAFCRVCRTATMVDVIPHLCEECTTPMELTGWMEYN